MLSISTNDGVVATEASQTLRHKTITTPIIASLDQASNGGIINLPVVTSRDTATLATTADISNSDSAINEAN